MAYSSKYIDTVWVNGAYQADYRENAERRKSPNMKYNKFYDRRIVGHRRQSSRIDVQV